MASPARRMFATYQLELGRSWVPKHIILLLVLKPSNVTTHGQSHRKIVGKKQTFSCDTIFILFLVLFFSRTGWLLAFALHDNRSFRHYFVLFSYPTQLRFGNRKHPFWKSRKQLNVPRKNIGESFTSGQAATCASAVSLRLAS